MSLQHTVYNAATGICLLDCATEGQFDRWYDHHSQYRQVRNIAEVNPDFRDLYDATSAYPNVHWLTEDAA